MRRGAICDDEVFDALSRQSMVRSARNGEARQGAGGSTFSAHVSWQQPGSACFAWTTLVLALAHVVLAGGVDEHDDV